MYKSKVHYAMKCLIGKVLKLNELLMQDKSKESTKRFRKLEYFDIGDILYFVFIFLCYF